jgi:hypothetical protein
MLYHKRWQKSVIIMRLATPQILAGVRPATCSIEDDRRMSFVVKKELLAALGIGCDNGCLVISGSSVGPYSPCNLLLIMFYISRLPGLMLSWLIG